MPRLLLVDENASIRRSAEILLGGTDMELVAVATAQEALDQVTSGTSFDVALIHAFLPGDLDGWQLLAHFRQHPTTARMPIALMAGVLKEVDPVQIAEAPIQGFLRKPIELGNLRDRLATILATPVPEPAPPAETIETAPGRSLVDLLPLPETRAEEATYAEEAPTMERDDDLLMLEIQDLYPGETVPAAPEAPVAALDFAPPAQMEWESPASEDSLELEELDLDALRTLEPAAEAPAWSQPTPQDLPSVPDLQPTWEEVPVSLSQELPEAFSAEGAPETGSDLLSELEASEGTVDLPDLGGDLELEPFAPMDLPVEAPPEAPAAAVVEAPQAQVAPAAIQPLESSADANALVQALVANPAALDALCRAVVAELGDRALKEIAWEIMPDLAEKLRK